MWSSRGCLVPRLALGLLFLLAVQGGHCEHEPTESECRPYIERALKEHHVESEELHTTEASIEQEENPPIDEQAESSEDSQSQENAGDTGEDGKTEETAEGDSTEGVEDENKTDEQGDTQEEQTEGTEESIESAGDETNNEDPRETNEDNTVEDNTGDVTEETDGSQETSTDNATEEEKADGESQPDETAEVEGSVDGEASEEGEDTVGSQETETTEQVESQESQEGDTTEQAQGDSQEGDTTEQGEGESQEGETTEQVEEGSQESETTEQGTTEGDSQEGDTAEQADGGSQDAGESQEDTAEKTDDASEEVAEAASEESAQAGATQAQAESGEAEGASQEDSTTETTQEGGVSAEGGASGEQEGVSQESETAEAGDVSQEGSQEGEKEEGGESRDSASEGSGDEAPSVEDVTADSTDSKQTEERSGEEVTSEGPVESVQDDTEEVQSEEAAPQEGESEQETPEEDLTMVADIPANLRPRDHITQILKLNLDSVETETARTKNVDSTLRTLKNIYDTAIKPLELLFKYRDLSNRHYGDPEIFSKPLVLFMGPWSGGKSSTINYLLDNEFTDMSLRTGAEPSPAYFNILMYGEEPEILDGTQLAADWTFSGLQKFGQGLLDRLRGVRLPNRLLEKVNIVEIPGILEIRKQVQRLFPFNDACQWFIDRADIIFLVYDPAKLDVGPETEAILDQLKGREYQTRIILNKADQVKPEELMRVQGTLIWNISPLMSSPEPPVMYTTSLWSLPYEAGAPTRLLFAQERAFLRDLREAIDKRVDNKIASARRFAVRVRNHAKMVDCYLTTYYNHKSFFGNRKAISDDIIENPTKYHIYEGLSTLTNISRYDLPDPDMYRDFFRLNPLYEFTKLSDTCTYFRGCPINKLDVAIAYDLPELVGKYKKAVEAAKHSNS